MKINFSRGAGGGFALLCENSGEVGGGGGGGGGGVQIEIPTVGGGMEIFWSHTLPKFLIIIQLNIFSCN